MQAVDVGCRLSGPRGSPVDPATRPPTRRSRATCNKDEEHDSEGDSSFPHSSRLDFGARTTYNALKHESIRASCRFDGTAGLYYSIELCPIASQCRDRR